jgi:rhamnosyl/mannosyltransferase
VFTLSSTPSADPIELPEASVVQAKKHAELASCGVSLSALSMFKEQVAWADVVNYHFPWPFADYLHFRAHVDKPTVLTYHSDIVRQRLLRIVYFPLMNSFLRSVDRVV